jgi:nucleoporin p58/p45
MSLARSASGPGGLTINTNAANSSPAATQPAASTGGLFGSGNAPATTTSGTAGGMASNLFGSTQPKAGGGLFGAAPAAQPAAGGSLFGGATGGQQTAAAPSTGGGLFGGASSTQQQPQQQQQAGGLFGKPAATTQTTGGGLFGGSTQQTTPQSTGGLFGNAQSTQTQQPAQQTGGLFGTPAAQPAQTQQTGGLFGGQTAQPAQTQQTGGLFGGQTAQPAQTQQTGGLFGQSTQMQAPKPGGLFGASTAPATGMASQAKPAGSLWGAQSTTQQNQNTAQVPAVQINYDNLRPRTRFDDLAQTVQEEISLIDKGIQRVMKMKDDVGEFMPQHEKDIEQLGRDVKFVESKFKAVQSALNRDIQTVKVLQDMTKKNITDAQLSFKATDNLKLPTHYHQTGLFASSSPAPSSGNPDPTSAHGGAQDLITYFNRICDDVEKYKKRLDEYRGEIERDMPGVEKGLYEQIRAFRDRNSSSVAVQDQLGQVLLALRETGTAIVSQAGQIADTRERLSRLQAGIVDSGVYAAGMTA